MRHLALGLLLLAGATAQEVSAPPGWQALQPTPGTHTLGTALAGAKAGRGCGFIRGQTAENNARGVFAQEFVGRTAVPAGQTYRWSLAWRTVGADERASVLIDCYGPEGEKSRKQLASQRLKPGAEWQTAGGTVDVPAGMVRVRLLLYLHGAGTVWWDEAFFGAVAETATNRLLNPGFEPPGSAVYEVAPESRSGDVRLVADFPNGVLGAAKQLGPDEWYVRAMPAQGPRSPFLWFHFRVTGCAGRTLTFHLNPAPFDREHTGGNGTRSPVASHDGVTWFGVADRSWNDDGTVLTCQVAATEDTLYLASFYPYPPQRVRHQVDLWRSDPSFAARVLARMPAGNEQWLYTITDRAVADAAKPRILFTTLQHDLETTGAMAVEGLCGWLLSDDPAAAALRRRFVFLVVPQMNPDGIAGGNLYQCQANLNRQWGLHTAPETQSVEALASAEVAAGHRFELAMDFHGWCTPARQTLFMTFGSEISDAATEADAVRLANTIGPRTQSKASVSVWRKMVNYVTMGDTDVRRLMPGWLKYEAGARLAYSIEIFGEGECTQDQYLAWGQAFGAGLAEFYATRP